MALSLDARKVAYAASAVFVAVLIAVMHLRGVPLFLQDWIWPFTQQQAAQLFRNAGHLWQEGNGGFAAASPNGVVVAWFLFGGAALLGPLTALNIELGLLAVIGFSGTFCYLKFRGATWWGAAFGAALFAGSPVFYNKLEAGHYYYLVAYAFVPLGFALMAVARCTARPLRAAAATVCAGCAFAVAAAQFQFSGILLIAVAVELIAWRNVARAALIGAGAAALMIALHLPDYYIMLAPQSLAQYAPQATPAAWLASQSQTFREAIASISYIGGYAGRALPPAAVTVFQVAVLLAVAFGFLAAIKTRSSDSSRTFFAGAAFVAIGAAIVSGTLGPLAIPIAYAFSHDVHFSAFRELYDFAVLTQFGIALIVASALAKTKAGIAVAAMAACLLLLSLAIYVTATPSKTIPSAPPATLARALRLDREPDPARIAFLPSSPSVSLRGAAASGIDSYGQFWGMRPAVVDTIADTRYAYVLASRSGSPGLWGRLNVDYVVVREETVSNYPQFLDPYSRKIAETIMPKLVDSPGFHANAMPAPRMVRLTHRVAVSPPLWRIVENMPAENHSVSVPLSEFNSYVKHSISVDPLHGWTQSLRWYGAIPALACLPAASDFRITSVAHLRTSTPACGWRLLPLNNGLLCYRLDAAGLAAEGPCINEGRYRSLKKQLDVRTREAVDRSFVLAYIGEGYDPRWELRCSGGEEFAGALPVLVDANSMGWMVPNGVCRGKFSATFGPDRWFQSLLIAVWSGAVAAALVLFTIDSRMKHA